MIIFYLTLLIFQYHISVYESSMNLLGLTKLKSTSPSNNNNNNNNNNNVLPDGTFDIDFTNQSSTRFNGKALKIDIENLEIFTLGGILRIFNSKALTQSSKHFLEFDSFNNIFKIILDHNKISYVLNKNIYFTFDFSKPDQGTVQFIGTARFYDVWIDQIISRSTMINLCRSDRLLTGYSIIDAELCNTDVSQTHLSLSATLEYISNVLYAVSKDYAMQNKSWSESFTILQSSVAELTINLSNITDSKTNHIDEINDNLLSIEEFLGFNRSMYDAIYELNDEITVYVTTLQNQIIDKLNQTSTMTNTMLANLSGDTHGLMILTNLLDNRSHEQSFLIDLIHKDIEYLQMNLTNIAYQLSIQTNVTHTIIDTAITTLTNHLNVSLDLQNQQYLELIHNLTDSLVGQANISYNQCELNINQSNHEMRQQYLSLQTNFTDELYDYAEQCKQFTDSAIVLLSNQVQDNLSHVLNVNKEIYDNKFILLDQQFKNVSDHFSHALTTITDNNTLMIQDIKDTIATNEANTSHYLQVLVTNTSAAIARSNSILAKVIGEVNISVSIYREEAISFVENLNKNFLAQVNDIRNEVTTSTNNMHNISITLRDHVINHMNERIDMVENRFEQAILNASLVMELLIKNLTNQVNDDISKHSVDIDLMKLQQQHLNKSILQNSLTTNESLLALYHNISSLLDDTIMRFNMSLSHDIMHQIQSASIEPLRLDLETKISQLDVTMQSNLTNQIQSVINKTEQTFNASISEYYNMTIHNINIINDSTNNQLSELHSSITNHTNTQLIEYKVSVNNDLQRLNHSIINHYNTLQLESFKNLSNLEDKLHDAYANHSILLITQSEEKLVNYVTQQHEASLVMMNTSFNKQSQGMLEQYQYQTSIEIHQREKEFAVNIQELKELIQYQNQRMTLAEKKIEDQANEIKLLQNYNYQLVKDIATVESVDQLRRLLFDLQGSMLVHSSKVLDILLQKHICTTTNKNDGSNSNCSTSNNSPTISTTTQCNACEDNVNDTNKQIN